ncbi:DUF4349 domain-containing protein [Diaphorobacter sp.]|uniref:DUF4349 domain-containing protein n=1 Tax=Diaphorobacter sp. TaxID=1934310 RepID=UPI0028B24430|nr:DUF4349 domain-containing protein [Diaphorobacter sp.]
MDSQDVNAKPGKWLCASSLLVCVLLLGACAPQDEESAPATTAMHRANQGAMLEEPARLAAPVVRMDRERKVRAEVADAAAVDNAQAAATPDAAAQRHLAVRHEMQIESPAADLAELWSRVKARCEQLDCEVEMSALQRETSHSAGSAYLFMRVNPRDFAQLTDSLSGTAKVLNHQTSSEDKTNEVIDVEAQIKNRSEYRDSLRELLREKGVKRTLSDLMEIRDTLSRVQAEIDAATTQRQRLEKETAKQVVRMRFQPQPIVLTGRYNPWMQTSERAWNALLGSMQQLVITVAALLPWMVVLMCVLLVGVPIMRKLWRARRKA